MQHTPYRNLGVTASGAQAHAESLLQRRQRIKRDTDLCERNRASFHGNQNSLLKSFDTLLRFMLEFRTFVVSCFVSCLENSEAEVDELKQEAEDLYVLINFKLRLFCFFPYQQ